jgi:hypothetical protein
VPFIIKQNDLEPYLPYQILNPDGTPKDLSTATSISIVVRSKGSNQVAFKSPTVIDDPLNGLGHYEWAVGDTANSGDFEYELEILWQNAKTQTVPVDSYFALTIVADIG